MKCPAYRLVVSQQKQMDGEVVSNPEWEQGRKQAITESGVFAGVVQLAEPARVKCIECAVDTGRVTIASEGAGANPAARSNLTAATGGYADIAHPFGWTERAEWHGVADSRSLLNHQGILDTSPSGGEE